MDWFSDELLRWHAAHGRHDLPWQRDATAYRVWISEIMLQQTRVTTVIPYFERFVARFPALGALAGAPLDEVLHHWAGLGYYARARNLHRAAQRVVAEHGGELPRDSEGLSALPGIGRSTAAAILAIAHGERHAILDGNVKRVLARFHRVAGWPGEVRVAKRLWALAERHTPARRVRDYTQAIMDLGATLCTNRRPDCAACPVAGRCAARTAGCTERYPAAKPHRDLPRRTTRVLVAQRADGALLLERRPPYGVWGGLWSFPELAADDNPAAWCDAAGLVIVAPAATLASLAHTFTHFHLQIVPIHVRVRERRTAVRENGQWVWHASGAARHIGLAKPVSKLLNALPSSTEESSREPHR